MPPKLFVWQGISHGGAARITGALAAYAQAHGFSVTVGRYTHDPLCPLPQLIIPVPRLIPSSFRPLVASLLYRCFYARRFAAVYTHTIGAWRAPHQHLFVHEAADLDRARARLASPLKRFVMRFWQLLYHHLTLRRASQVFCATDECLAYARRHHINEAAISPSSSFFDGTIFTFASHRPPRSPLKLVFVGDYHDPAKNFPYVMQQFLGHPGYHLHICGGNTTGQDRNFHYFGYCPPAHLKKILDSSDFFFMPSLSEGFPLALLEALACGIPCLANRGIIPRKLAVARGLIPFSLQNDIHHLVKNILPHYQEYNVPDSQLQQFTTEKILNHELRLIAATLHQSPTDIPRR